MAGAARRGRLAVVGALLTTLLILIGGKAAFAASGEAKLYFFWGEGCPHCAAAAPVLEEMEKQNPGLEVVSYEIWADEENLQLFVEMASRHGFEPTGVPTFFLGDQHWVGFGAGTAEQIEDTVTACIASGCPDAATYVPGESPPGASEQPGETPPSPVETQPAQADDTRTVEVPIIGEVNVGGMSLTVITLLISAVDGFNPCSMWVLGVLLALTLRSGSRKVTLIVGLTFIAVTALVYALFIAGIFTIVSIAAMAPWLRILVALIALTFALINIKDYFWFSEGVSLSIPESAKPGIYARMRNVMANTERLPMLVVSTVLLATGVSVVELACTAGFPIVWTNILAERGVTGAGFLLLLLIYMLVYQLDELLIFGAAVVTLRASKLQEKHGRILKLVGGVLMLTLAAVMIIDPSMMGSLGSTLLVFGSAAVTTLLILLLHRVIFPRLGIQIGTEVIEPGSRDGAAAKGRGGGRPGKGSKR
jgi:thiol-disulfide isomerase/thioredoxin